MYPLMKKGLYELRNSKKVNLQTNPGESGNQCRYIQSRPQARKMLCWKDEENVPLISSSIAKPPGDRRSYAASPNNTFLIFSSDRHSNFIDKKLCSLMSLCYKAR